MVTRVLVISVIFELIALTITYGQSTVGSDTFHISDCNRERYETIDYSKHDLSGYRYVDLSCSGLKTLKNLKLDKVVSLNISNNNISSLDSIRLDSLEILDISGTMIRNSFSALCNSKKLRIIKHDWFLNETVSCVLDNGKIEILNTPIVEPLPPQIERCKMLRNLLIFTSLDSTVEESTFKRISQIPSLTHLGILHVTSLKIEPETKNHIESLMFSPASDKNLSGIVEELKGFNNLKRLEISIFSKKFEYDISFLTGLETLIIKKTKGTDRVELPGYVSEFPNLKEIYDFKNLKTANIKKGVKIIRSSHSPVFTEKNYEVISYKNPIFIYE